LTSHSSHPHFLTTCVLPTPLRATDEVFQLLEDNQVTLSTRKASRYEKASGKEVYYWEMTLSLVLEVVEVILQVQRQWM
jgi:dynein heavy chain